MKQNVKNDIQKLIDNYVAWLKDNTQLRQIEDWVEISTPYLDRHNDFIQIYAKKNNGGYLLTDDGYTIDDLEMCGCNITHNRQELLQTTINGFGVQLLDDKRLEVYATRDNFAMRKHNLIQSMLAVNDLFYTVKPVVESLFLEDVTAWLELNEIRFTPNTSFAGKSGYIHNFQFIIPASKKKPERILQTLSHPDKERTQSLAFSWIDTKNVRPRESTIYAFLNDSGQAVSSSVIDALNQYEIRPILWSQRDAIREELAA